MRSAVIIAGGLLLLGLFALVGWRFGGGSQGIVTATKVFAAVWLLAALVNMWIGVSRAGYSVAEAKTIPGSQLLLPQLGQFKELALTLVDLAKSYRQAGEESSAQAVLEMTVNLGRQYGNTPGETEIGWLVGMAIERMALKAMDPTNPYGIEGQTVQGRINQLDAKRSELKELNQKLEPLLPTLSDQDWISYKDRWRAFGEESAVRWVVNKYGQK